VEKAWATINGVRQGMVIQTTDLRRPVLLDVHGGPGMPDWFLTERYPTRLHEACTVVWWDQRGTALSYSPRIPRSSMTIEQLVADTVAVARHLAARFDQPAVYVLGHSWGSFLAVRAVQRAPDAFAAYVGTGQMVHQHESEVLTYEFMLRAFHARGDRRMVRRLEATPVTMGDPLPAAYTRLLRDQAMHALGTGTTHDMHSLAKDLVLPSLCFRGYTPRERLALWRGRSFSRGFHLWDEAFDVDLRTTVPRLEVPVHLFEGVFDRTCDQGLAKDWLARLDAPAKGYYSFLRSAHSPVMEEPDRALELLREDVLTGTTAHADPL
jgi:pimeloyl-ACP methyl ester carboxylesterase